MTPAEVVANLRVFNDWRRGDETTAQPDPHEISEAIDAAIEMIERLESAEKERANANAAAVNIALEAERLQCENDALRSELKEVRYGVAVAHDTIKALRAKIEAIEKRLRLILEEPENTMSNSKAMREMIRQARLALEESK